MPFAEMLFEKKNTIMLVEFELPNIEIKSRWNGLYLWEIYTNFTHITAGEEAGQQLHKNVAGNIEQVLAATSHKAPTIRPPAFHHENYPS